MRPVFDWVRTVGPGTASGRVTNVLSYFRMSLECTQRRSTAVTFGGRPILVVRTKFHSAADGHLSSRPGGSVVDPVVGRVERVDL